MQSKPTRRTFFGHAGAALAAPLAAGAALTGQNDSGNDLAARLAALEDANAIRALLQQHAQRVNAGADLAPDSSVRRLTLDPDVSIDFGADGTATAQVACSVDIAMPIDGRETLVEMARLQGDGVVKGSERRVLRSSFAKRDGEWQFLNAEFQA